MAGDVGSSGTAKAPWHLWVIGLLALLWYVSGTATIQLAQLGKLPGITPDEAAYYAAKPAWAIMVTAVGTYGSVLATILLLLRRKASVVLFALALAAVLGGNGVELIEGTSRAYANTGAAFAIAAIAAIAIGLALYARAMRMRDVLH
ncbi:MAG: hypothetical protein J0I69_14880 [Altererythrobacter sp.]|nr:hypothetical protein [Altererythrobacter sp.]OJU61233.1 MAG: hypothetical protein BGO08_07255 [Altererythrobacter sp. 66-12]